MEFTSNKVGYEWELAGAAGAAFYLRPHTKYHTPNDVVLAKKELKDNQDVLYFGSMQWVDTYGGEYFRMLRREVKEIQKLKMEFKSALSPENRERFNAMLLWSQRWVIMKAMEDGKFTTVIK